MKPYWLMFFSQAACAIYLMFELGTKTSPNWIKYMAGFFLAIKMCLENLAISLQIYEWLCLYTMINFQGQYNMDRVEVVLDKFKKIEKRLWFIFKAFVIVIIIAAVIIAFYCFVKSKRQHKDMNDEPLINEFQIIVGFLLLSFLIITLCLFFYKANRKQKAEFDEHKVLYSIQASGMFLAIVTNLVTEFCYKKIIKENKNPIVVELLIRNFAGFIFVLSKTPKDCFLCFSKLKNIKYSIWQYVKFTYTEQFLLIRRNAFLLKEL